MGELRERRIVQSRIWLDPNQTPISNLDYDYSYPITVYEAVKQTMDDNSPSLADELESIYRLINSKQDIIDGGIPGQLMTWSGVRGQIGATEVVKSINKEASLRSHKKIPTEKAIGDALDGKVSNQDFNMHVNNTSMHVTDVEKTRWNQMAPLSSLEAHMKNSSVHVTDKERAKWNGKADQELVDDHIYDMNNPHNTTAHQVGTYTQREIDEMFQNIRESFFNYLNIEWDDRVNQAKLVEYHAANWNPNFILEWGDNLPDVPDPARIYFALQPATDYEYNESQDCRIWVKRPGLVWQEIGYQSMNIGDMVIRFPDTTMYVWVQGRFLKLFSGNSNDVMAGDGMSTKVWKPVYDEETGMLSWEQSDFTDAPEPMLIKGKDGITPVKGVDYDDGKDGEGVAPGGRASDVLVKLTDENYDTTWKGLMELLLDLVLAGESLPDGIVIWEHIKGRPEWYNELGDNDDGFITQKAATRQFGVVNNQITEIIERLDGLDKIKGDLYDHINDFNNPHRVTPSQIGAVPVATFTDHVQNFNNPHNVSADQIGLGNVNNTSDIDKPISNATQEALDELLKKIKNLTSNLDGYNAFVKCIWNDKGCNLIFEYRDGQELTIHIPIIETFNSIYYDEDEEELVIILPDGSEHRIDISKLIITYYGSVSDNIQVVVEEDGHIIKATVIPGSIGENEIQVSVHLKGSPTTTTQPVSDKSTRIATTEYVRNQVIDNLISYETDRALSANMGRILNQRKADIEDVIQIINDMEGIEVIDNLDSTNPLAALSANMGRHLDLTKAPRVHTSPSGSTFGRATIEYFGHTRASDEDPLMDGTVFRGTDNGEYARGDHRHPTDITRAPMHWPDVDHDQYELTGEPRSSLPPDDDNSNWIATTEWVRRNAVGVSFGRCDTGTNETTKLVALESTYMKEPVLILQKGTTVSVTFTHDAITAGVDKASSKTGKVIKMNVQDTGEYPIHYGGVNIISEMIKGGYTYIFTFDGEFWNLENPTGTHTLPDDDYSNSLVSSEWVRRNSNGSFQGTSVTAGTNPNKIATLRSSFMTNVAFLRQIGSTVAIEFSDVDNSGTTATTLNVNNTGAAKIMFGGKEMIDGMIGTKHTHMFIFDGQYWQLQNPVPGTGYGTIVLGPNNGAAVYSSNSVSMPISTVNALAGHNGFTVEGDGGVDSNGQVKRVWVEVTYEPRVAEVELEVCQTKGAFAIKFGDGTQVEAYNPKVISTSRTGSVIQFTIDNAYPCNSPCQLVYKTSEAFINVTEVNT